MALFLGAKHEGIVNGEVAGTTSCPTLLLYKQGHSGFSKIMDNNCCLITGFIIDLKLLVLINNIAHI